MATRELKVEIVGDSRSLEKALGNATSSSSKFGSTFAKVGKVAALGLVAVGAGAVVAGKKMLEMASDAAEVDSKLDVVFGKTLPGLTKNLDAFSEATGASRFELREQAADMGALLVPLTATKQGAADMSEQFVKLAADLSSFNNVPVDEALLAIRSGLVGEAEPLRRFGVLLNEASVKAEAYSSGIAKVGSELTEQQKVQARANLIMDQTKLAQDDATETAGSMANQMRALQNNVRDAATEIGMKLIPVALAVVKAFNENWPQIEEIVDRVLGGLIKAFELVAKSAEKAFGFIKENQTAFEVFAGAAIVVGGLSVALSVATTAQTAFNIAVAANPYVLAAAAVAALAGALVVLYLRNKEVHEAVNKAFIDIKQTVMPIIVTLQAAWARFGEDLVSITRTTFGVVATLVETYLRNILAPFKIFFALLRGDWTEAWNEVKATVSRTLGAIVTVIRGYIDIWLTAATALGKAVLTGVAAGVAGLANAVAEQMQNVWNALKSAASTAYNFALEIGKSMARGIADGFMSLIGGIKDKIVGAVQGIGSAIGGALHIGSPSRVYAKEIGMPMAEGILVGFQEGAAKLLPAITQSLAGISTSIKSGTGEGGTALGDFTTVVEAVSTAVVALKDNMAALAVEGTQHFKLLTEGLQLYVPPAIDILQTLLDKLNQIREMYLGIAGAADKAGDVTGIDLSSLVGLQKGGVVTKPTLALIGEAGPEAVVPLGRSYGAMPGGVNLTVNVHGSVTSERDLVTSIRNAIVAEGRRSGGGLMGGYA